jgi:uncharacterized protein YaiE (UPF0345 family)
MGAVPQRGGSSNLFGGTYRAVGVERAIGSNKCITVIAADRYATSSNNKYKMDIVTRAIRSPEASAVNQIRPGNHLVPLGRMNDLVPPQRKIQRKR